MREKFVPEEPKEAAAEETEEEQKGEAQEKEKLPKFDLGKEFIESKGKVFAWYPDGRPSRWECGQGEHGEPIDPKGMRKEAIHYLNEKGKWEAGNPDEELLAEIKRWRNDWMDPK